MIVAFFIAFSQISKFNFTVRGSLVTLTSYLQDIWRYHYDMIGFVAFQEMREPNL